MTPEILAWARRVLLNPIGDVLEVGSRDVNGSLRSILARRATRYVGVDIEAGRGVDVVADALDVGTLYPGEFDLVVCTEMLEHTLDWQAVIASIKAATKPGGRILVTAPAPGFKFHAFPNDFWRFSPEVMLDLFIDCMPLAIRYEASGPTTMLYVRKPTRVRIAFSTLVPEPAPPPAGRAS